MRIVLAIALSFCASEALGAIQLSHDGKSDYTIVVNHDASPVERTAATELQKYFQQITGATLPIADFASGNRIFIRNQNVEGLGPDGISIRTEGGNLYLEGPAPRGAIYAVVTFLEDQLGVRWWTNTESTVPHRADVAIENLDIKYTPKLRYRESFHHHVLGNNYETAVHFKLNGNFSRIPDDWGGHYDILGWCHTSYQLLPPGTYFAQHPDWYSERGGKRTPDGTQLCWSNPDMQKELARRALEWIRKNPRAGIISISQNDQIGFCECEKCRAIDAANGGAHSASLITGINAVADVIAKEYPDFLVETLAYQYSRKAPTQVKPAKNVLVRLCSIECDFSHPLSGESNKSFGDDLRNWSKLAQNLFIWNYTTNFSNYLIPQPNLMPTADDLRFFVDHNVVGVFEQADSGNHLAGDMLPLRCWLQAHLMWDPSRDQDALIHEFLNGYYGAAGPHLDDYLQIVNAPAKDPMFRRGCYHTDAAFLTRDAMKRCDDAFDAAEKAVANQPALLQRVKRERLALEHAEFLNYDFAHRIAEAAQSKNISQDEAAISVCNDYEAKTKAFCERAMAAGVKNYSEGIGFSGYESSLMLRGERFVSPKLPKAGDALPKGAIDIQEDRFKLINEGTDVEIVVDDAASNGKAARMPGSHRDWAVQFPIPKDSKEFGPGPWKCYVVARVKLKRKAGKVFEYGIFDAPSHTHAAVEGADVEIAGDEKYHAYGMRVNALKPGEYFWVSPPGGDAVEAVYVDRIYLLKEAAK